MLVITARRIHRARSAKMSWRPIKMWLKYLQLDPKSYRWWCVRVKIVYIVFFSPIAFFEIYVIDRYIVCCASGRDHKLRQHYRYNMLDNMYFTFFDWLDYYCWLFLSFFFLVVVVVVVVDVLLFFLLLNFLFNSINTNSIIVYCVIYILLSSIEPIPNK